MGSVASSPTDVTRGVSRGTPGGEDPGNSWLRKRTRRDDSSDDDESSCDNESGRSVDDNGPSDNDDDDDDDDDGWNNSLQSRVLLNANLLFEILSHLDPREVLVRATAVCRRWRRSTMRYGEAEEGNDFSCLKKNARVGDKGCRVIKD